MIEYELIRSKRKTLAIHVKPDGKVEVRAPYRVNLSDIDKIVEGKTQWIMKVRNKILNQQSGRNIVRLSPKESDGYKNKALAYFAYRCPFFAEKMGVRYNKIKVNQARTRWGSCNSKGEINFTCRLVFVPEELVDYVIVHELAHLKEMNHSKKFWALVEEILPDYKIRRKKLKELNVTIEIE